MCTSVCATHLSIETMEAFDTIARSPYVAVALTFVIFILARAIQRRSGMAMLNPILVTIAALVAILCLGGIDYETYDSDMAGRQPRRGAVAGCEIGHNPYSDRSH